MTTSRWGTSSTVPPEPLELQRIIPTHPRETPDFHLPRDRLADDGEIKLGWLPGANRNVRLYILRGGLRATHIRVAAMRLRFGKWRLFLCAGVVACLTACTLTVAQPVLAQGRPSKGAYPGEPGVSDSTGDHQLHR